MKIIRNSAIVVVISLVIFFILIYSVTYHPKTVEVMEVVNGPSAPEMKSGADIKVMCWNVQYFAGKNYFFWYDILDYSGPDIRPSKEDMAATRREMAGIIKEENPDVIILQELHEKAKRTGYEDQLALLLELLPEEYSCYTSCFYWKAAFMPIKQVMGSVGVKLVTISKYKLTGAVRYQLPIIPMNIIAKEFNFKRAVLEARIAMDNGSEFALLNTHLDAFAQNHNTMEQQVKTVKKILTGLDEESIPWVIGGDFNLLANKKAYSNLYGESKTYYNPETELNLLTSRFNIIPTLEELSSDERERWFTYFPNNPEYNRPISTIDYLFYSDLLIAGEHKVRSEDTLTLSDHLPIIAVFTLSKS